MSLPDAEVALARARAAAARAKLDASVEQAKVRLNPRALAGDALDGARLKAGELAGDAVDGVRQRPALAAAVAGALGLLLARKPITRLIRRDTDETETNARNDDGRE